MNRKSMFVMLVVFMALSLVLGGCRKSATPPVADIQTEEQGEDESHLIYEEAIANPTPITVDPVTIVEEAPVVEPVETVTEAPAPTVVIEAPEETVVIAPVIVSGEEAPPPPEAAPAPVVVSTPGKHVVQAGENLFRIALRYGTTVEAIAKANGITNAALIYVGQTLTIPGGTPPTTPKPPGTGGRVHVVQAGDNLFRIALKYNYSQFYLAQYNGISNPSLIYVGQVIRIP